MSINYFSFLVLNRSILTCVVFPLNNLGLTILLDEPLILKIIHLYLFPIDLITGFIFFPLESVSLRRQASFNITGNQRSQQQLYWFLVLVDSFHFDRWPVKPMLPRLLKWFYKFLTFVFNFWLSLIFEWEWLYFILLITFFLIY